ncbi:MAG: 5-dehydro-4-deoxy-D-glucuronate isomerase [Terracidiphilus sp.]|nr:5-dehydro-4-deoxy-D-glucuronate isomerase [Terracidiphilus sp.]MDR3775834.1 5-dehydro-4-deoxy-D-glucuronate isomerase [Terracidiphilus sp.]
MKTILMADPVRFPRMTTEETRNTFLLNVLYEPGKINFNYAPEIERVAVGMAAPVDAPIALPTYPQFRANYFTERRELGALNIGGTGVIRVGDKSYELNNLDVLYIGRGNPEVSFESKDKANPAVFYLLSYPAHATYPTALVRKEDANPTEMGSAETCNHRTICKYIHLEGARSCQLVMGVTHLHPGSSWNTLPAHTHDRRTEVYMYFNMPDTARVFHLMGAPDETRHIIMANRDVVISPVWSIHSGVGTQAYSFCWGMGGENQVYSDMDPAPLADLR